jgi:uncharacterized coiled-coil protein SlyX
MTPTLATPDTSVDSRAIHRKLTGLRDRLRLQEDELDWLRETIRPEPQKTGLVETGLMETIEALEARVQRVEQAMANRPVQALAPVFDPKALAEDTQEKVERNLLPQVRALETQVAEQRKTLQEAFELMGRTDMNVRRLISQVDRLLEQVSRGPIEVASRPLSPRSRDRSQLFTAVDDLEEYDEPSHFGWKLPVAILALSIMVVAAGCYWYFNGALPLLTAPK